VSTCAGASSASGRGRDAAADGRRLTEEAFVERKDRLAVPRVAEPDEISPAVIYFASDLSGYASGSELLVDGDWAIG
jgi:NAD(P)-dependent dehydrogenase (short-subunit alcohol dehydrogenase family)